MLLFALFVVGVVYIFARGLGYDPGSSLSLMGMALIFAGVMNIGAYYFSDSMVLGISGARKIELKDNRELYHLVENLCIASGLPTPSIYTIEDSAPNAFATGRDPAHSVICFTTGILDKLNKQELEGVIGHELSHIRNRDTLLMSVVSILVGLVALLADWFLRMQWYRGGRRDSEDRGGNGVFLMIALIASLLAPLIATLIQLAISRRREFLADASSALLTRNPEQLAQALLKISADKEPLEAANRATAHLYITNPLKGSEVVSGFANLFNTHPPVEKRVAALQAMQA
ncbi:zinc metalloprotease HtpX [Candidatus Daviesbacteria bacterium RIFCSPHIGHO2_01_FULL_44_29]|uniref:Protease HtpX homolog n=1 Tax=Candidatus Daviesbacteria bacterium RIFCSPHIGHO2_02_FULL_43_12 TaxID=1797776 RepID=A0A1F5KKG5_9BACT|nr:MAG: zinc metalloprotease HtpX [Candidatus Daviesbacteria bacterium RIFCSPHIGHO2_01_FULL_44_29]OGE41427.1 MAG: zinc metalloprotease HtpX [Candidatus Daviesbacteria bacterium RIFCSPHIGHO2_02_FULL_43_12]OGE41564.1 MAG: zinc metalloprotease HtpX [Candidatus Daviesbacteria bacterium RIFCSPHIGHO2_12_FULL_47_45]OGE69627.1 MAG: zinc metalloprotease HtpX [Candidatus Daviesbacteria bacterium RIFCSPLOWO2_01_FULL_43_15]